MSGFSIRESLKKLKTKNYDPAINRTLETLTANLNEDQLRILLMTHGLKVDNNVIRLYFYENVGFRCMNERQDFYGKMPICNNIEKFMNNLYENFESKGIWNIGDIMIFNFSHEANGSIGIVIAKLEDKGYTPLGETELIYSFKGFKIAPEEVKGEPYDFSFDEESMDYLEIGEHSIMYPTDEQIKEFFPEEWKQRNMDKFDL